MYIELFVVGLVGYALFKVVARGFYTVKPDERAVITSFGRAERLGDAMVEDDSMDSTESAGLAQCVQQPAPRGEVCEALPATVQAAITAPGHGARGAANGFAISLASEWIANPEGDYEKQDCERKAFVRLAAKLKQFHPRLPICLTADGLYPYQGFFDICRANAWTFILTFKDGNFCAYGLFSYSESEFVSVYEQTNDNVVHLIDF